MRIPKLDHRITIQRNTPTTNTYNEPVESWGDYITVWASRRDASAREGYKAAEVGSEITARFTIRYSSETATITAKDRVILQDGLTYEIVAAPRETVRNKWIELDCVARADK